MMSEVAGVPFNGSYWVIPGRILAGPYPEDPSDDERSWTMARGLVELGIDRVINLVESHDFIGGGAGMASYGEKLVRLSEEAGRQYQGTLRFPLRDFDVPSAAAMKEILAVIKSGLESGETVYVHCQGGRGRTGTVVGCLLIELGVVARWDVESVLEGLRQKENLMDVVPETIEQLEFVLRWRG